MDAGRRKGITVTEVARHLRGVQGVHRQEPSATRRVGAVNLDNQTYDRLKAKTEAWLAKFDKSVGDFNSLATPIRSRLS